MATLRFNGTTAYLQGTAPGGLNGAYTIATLVKRVSFSGADCIISTQATGPAAGFSFFLGGSKPEIYNDNTGGNTSPATSVPGPLSVDDTDLRIVVVTRGTGETPRFHIKNITDATAWAHGDGETVQTTNPDAATLSVHVGMFNFPGVGDFDHMDGDIGLIGWWNGVEMSDVQVEALSTNLRTSDWHSHAAGTPSSCSQLLSTSPTDLEGLVTWTNNGATATGDNMAAWNFDGTGGGAPATSLVIPRRRDRLITSL